MFFALPAARHPAGRSSRAGASPRKNPPATPPVRWIATTSKPGEPVLLADMPAGIFCPGGFTVNAEETIVVGNGGPAKDHADAKPLTMPANRGSVFADTFNRRETHLLLSVDIRTGKATELQPREAPGQSGPHVDAPPR